MATHDYVISNGTGSAVRSDINGALAAIVSQNSNASAPATTYAYMSWADTSAGVMKMRNGANSAWISLYELDGTFLASDISLAAGSAAAPSLFFIGDTNTGLFSPGADTVALATAGQNRLHVSSGGLVGIGTTSPSFLLDASSGSTAATGRFLSSSTTSYSATSYNGGSARLTLYGGSATSSFTGTQYSHGGNVELFFGVVQNSSGLGEFVFQGYNGSAYAERARIDSSGRLLVGTSTFAGKGLSLSPNGNIITDYNGTGAFTHIEFKNNNGSVGSIQSSGSSTAYNTSSDYRLKENIIPVPDGITRFKQLKPSRFNFIADPDHTVDGFLAHEAQAVVPECITGEKDAVDEDGNPVYQGIDQSKLVPLLTAALQEAIAKIEALETRLTAAGIA